MLSLLIGIALLIIYVLSYAWGFEFWVVWRTTAAPWWVFYASASLGTIMVLSAIGSLMFILHGLKEVL